MRASGAVRTAAKWQIVTHEARTVADTVQPCSEFNNTPASLISGSLSAPRALLALRGLERSDEAATASADLAEDLLEFFAAGAASSISDRIRAIAIQEI